MKQAKVYRLTALLLLGLLLATSTAPSALAGQDAAGPQVSIRPQDPIHVPVSGPRAPDRQLLLAYWTPERMAAAKPHPGLQRPGEPVPGDLGRELLANGPARAVDGNLKGAPAYDAQNRTLQRFGTGTPALTYPFAYDKFEPHKKIRRAFPAKMNGKLFFKQDGIDYVCSGTSVTSGVGGNENLVLTAAHCLNSGGTGVGQEGIWSTDLVFVPAYREGTMRFGQWTFLTPWAFGDWITYSNEAYDYGFLSLVDSTNGSLSDNVGAQGMAWNQSDHWIFTNYGYPALDPYTGENMKICVASAALRDMTVPETPLSGEHPIGMGCDFTDGSSGGAWLIRYSMIKTSYINSVNSYKYVGQPLAVYGPYFDGEIETLWNTARYDFP